MIICDCCGDDITPNDDLEDNGFDRNFVELNGGKKVFCTDCWISLGYFACSDEHKKATNKYQQEFEQ